MARLIPNLLSAVRIVLAYPFFRAMEQGRPTAAAVFFVTAVATDLLDGRVARRLGSPTAGGRALDHSADFLFVVSGLSGAWLRGALTGWLPLVVAAAFAHYVADSALLGSGRGLRMSPLGRWNGVLYFVPLAGDILVGLGLHPLAPAVRLLAWALVLTTLLSMGERTRLLALARRRAPGSPEAGTAGRSPR